MLKQKIKTCSEFSFAKRIGGLAPKLAELEPFQCKEVRKCKILTKFFLQISIGNFKTGGIFLFFEIQTYFLVCNPILGSSLGVQKELGKNLFFLEIMGWAYMPTPAWNKLYQSPHGIGLSCQSQFIVHLDQFDFLPKDPNKDQQSNPENVIF